MRKFLIAFLVLVVVGATLYIFRTPILRSFATFLIVEDSLQKSDAIFVLSGGGFDRGNMAAKLYDDGWAPVVVCTGGNAMNELCVFGIDTLESDMTRANLLQLSIPDRVIVMLRNGTSTKEEAKLILAYCKAHQFKRIIIVSSKLHTHRVDEVFRQPLKDIGVELVIRTAVNSRFNELEWWKSEDGLIAINNEWLKTFYYWIKY
jgi:uncharacterized SAM-binding protein YcdF (DUF218 family)